MRNLTSSSGLHDFKMYDIRCCLGTMFRYHPQLENPKHIKKSDAEFEEKLNHGSKNDIRNMVKVSSDNSEKLSFDVLLLL